MDPVQQHAGLSEPDREWRRQKLLERSLPSEQLTYREDREAKRQVRLATIIYAHSLQGENMRMWTNSALKALARDCARAALAMSEAEALIFAHYAAKRSENGGGN